MANILMDLNKNKPKSCQGRNGSRSVYGRKAYTVPDMEEFSEESRKAFDKRQKKKAKPKKKKQVNAPHVSMGQYKETHRSEGSDG
ncbi:MAG: hypothetical protein GY861_19170 [bacterium]|nr:hypothetical protein [bacterium]